MADSKTCTSTPFNTALLTTQIIFVIFATKAVTVRIFASHRADGRAWYHADNWILASALLICWGFLIEVICACAITGINCYHADLSISWARKEVGKLTWAGIFLLIPASALSKISVLEYYKRIFVTRSFKWSCNIMIMVCSGWAIAAVVAQGLSTTPISASWSPETQLQEENYNYVAFACTIYGIGILLDVIVFCIPVPSTIRLHMPLARVVKLSCIFALGAFALTCSVLRFYYAYRALTEDFQNAKDQTEMVANAMLWSGMEGPVTIVTACTPTLGPIVCANGPLRSMLRSAGCMLYSPKSSRSNSTTSKIHNPTQIRPSGHWGEFIDGNLAHHHASIHSDPRPPSSTAPPNQILVSQEFSIDRAATMNEDSLNIDDTMNRRFSWDESLPEMEETKPEISV